MYLWFEGFGMNLGLKGIGFEEAVSPIDTLVFIDPNIGIGKTHAPSPGFLSKIVDLLQSIKRLFCFADAVFLRIV